MNKTILIVDDDKKIAQLIDFHLKKKGYATHVVYNGESAVAYADQEKPVLMFLDIRLPDVNGLEVLKRVKKKQPEVNVIMISAHADVKVAVDCMKIGAYDFVEKPIAFPELDAKVAHVFKQYSLEQEVTLLKKELGEKYKLKSLVGSGAEMQKVSHCIDLAAKSDVNVLIQGESGTGKELVARAIHFNGLRKEGPFVALNCGAIPDTLLESELFGYEKGAFTGAVGRKIGKFEQAQNGTIFLDEIGELSNTLQVKLLRVLQEREIERVGGSETIPIDVRFISATHQDLKNHIGSGAFREDLYFRLNVFPIAIPPLRMRKKDIPELFYYFIDKHWGQKVQVKIDNPALNKLVEYHWPGNVRELENFVERLKLLKGSESVIVEEDIQLLNHDLGHSAAESSSGWNKREQRVGQIEKEMLENALREAGGNVSKACRALNISRDTFYRKMKKHALTV
jgi:two-component system response regulator AtoC